MTDSELWNAYAAGEHDARERLLMRHLGLVRHQARHVARSVADGIELDELVSAGTLGLMEALERFEPSRGIEFSTFAVPRIRGAILDELRRLDDVPASIRRRTRAVDGSREALAADLGRAPGSRETAAHLGVNLGTLWRWQDRAALASPVRLDERWADEEGDGTRAEERIADGAPGVEEELTRRREIELMRDAILRLPEQERLVLSLCYFEELQLRDVARVLGVTESRISQIRSKGLARLRAALDPLRARVA